MISLLGATALAACGSSSNGSTVDAPPGGDAANNPDASHDGSSSAPVTVSYVRAGVPLAGVTVYFQNADQTLAGSAQTDANGSASHTIGAGGFVTTVIGTAAAGGTAYAVETLADVQPGDALSFGRPATTSATVTVTSATSTGANTYTLDTDCGNATLSGGLSATVSGSASLTCATTDMLVIAAPQNGTAKAAWNPNIAVVDKGTVALSAAYVAETPLTVSLTDVPAALTTVTATSQISTANGLLGRGTAAITPAAGSGSAAIQRPVTTGTDMYNATLLSGSDAQFGSEIDELQPSGSAYALDVGANLLPQFATAPLFSTTAHAVTWTENNVGTIAPEYVTALVTVTRGTTTWDWEVAQPRSGQSVVFPTLPTDVFDFTVVATDTFKVSVLSDAATPSAWDKLRPVVFGNISVSDVISVGAKIQFQHFNAK